MTVIPHSVSRSTFHPAFVMPSKYFFWQDRTHRFHHSIQCTQRLNEDFPWLPVLIIGRLPSQQSRKSQAMAYRDHWEPKRGASSRSPTQPAYIILFLSEYRVGNVRECQDRYQNSIAWSAWTLFFYGCLVLPYFWWKLLRYSYFNYYHLNRRKVCVCQSHSPSCWSV